jgi:hypothetical protein
MFVRAPLLPYCVRLCSTAIIAITRVCSLLAVAIDLNRGRCSVSLDTRRRKLTSE